MKYNVKIPHGWDVKPGDRSSFQRVLQFLESGARNAEIEVPNAEEARKEYVRISNSIGYHKVRHRVNVRMRDGRIFLVRMEEQNRD